ncbi:GMC oxidoreductase [Rhizoctonia solani AG-1 IA]|uniref:GMC oxidoreductase n=1 Tax=Thanatephorus cucumeris (strain AG1-IA) TaxID=983506 RepID=L8X0U8_THACA|nr:GMC oxidoreductase [Rhizoctonia solani AG-1 IA]
MPIVGPQDFVASEFDYIVVGGGTAGEKPHRSSLVVAARPIGREQSDRTQPQLQLTSYPLRFVIGRILSKPERVAHISSHISSYLLNFLSSRLHPHFDYFPIRDSLPLTDKLASSLSENPTVRVGVLEAGEYVPDEPNINVPGYFGRTIGNPAYDWGFLTVPQKDANGPFEALGNPGWNFKEFQRYFSKSETAHALPEGTAKKYGAEVIAPAGADGPIARSYPGWFSDLHLPLFDAYKTLGVDVNVDPNGGNNVGITTTACAIVPGKSTRSYSVTGYWEPYADRKNLILVTGARATKVALSKQGDLFLATGVEFVHGPEGEETDYTARARREVILSSGTFQSPQLLELSGIGQRRVLESVGIPVQVELNGVGENLQDHVYVPTMYEVTPDHETLDVLHEPEAHTREWEKFETKGEGMYASTHSAFSFLPLDAFAEEAEAQRVRVSLDDEGARYSSKGEKKLHGLLKAWMAPGTNTPAQCVMTFPEIVLDVNFIPKGFFPNPVTRPTPGHRYQSFLAALMHPASRGTSHVVSSDALAKPAIDPRYMSAASDVELLAAAVRFIVRLSKAGTMGPRVIGETMGAETADQDVKEYVKNKPVYHPIGTCSMLPFEDGGVVDSQLKVYGTANLSTVYAIAEKASDIIKATAV